MHCFVSLIIISQPISDEKAIVDLIYDNAIDGLKEEDKRLPQISHLKPFLQRGIGIHHSGLLPILKEVTEILFGEGLIKVGSWWWWV